MQYAWISTKYDYSSKVTVQKCVLGLVHTAMLIQMNLNQVQNKSNMGYELNIHDTSPRIDIAKPLNQKFSFSYFNQK